MIDWHPVRQGAERSRAGRRTGAHAVHWLVELAALGATSRRGGARASGGATRTLELATGTAFSRPGPRVHYPATGAAVNKALKWGVCASEWAGRVRGG